MPRLPKRQVIPQICFVVVESPRKLPDGCVYHSRKEVSVMACWSSENGEYS